MVTMVDQPSASQESRYRVTFSKRGVARFTGHLDLQRSWERALRRAGLTACLTKGFHPRPRLQFAAPLPLGLSSRAELLDLWLQDALEADELQRQLQQAASPGIEVLAVEALEPNAPRVTRLLRSADYRVPLAAPPPGLAEAVVSLLDLPKIERVRRDKPYDLRPLILALSWDDAERCLLMTLTVGQQTGRVDEVLAQLGLDPASCLIERTALNLAR
jgi:radical SAM-linked protein